MPTPGRRAFLQAILNARLFFINCLRSELRLHFPRPLSVAPTWQGFSRNSARALSFRGKSALADGPEDLPHEHRGRRVGREKIRRARRHQLDPERAQIVVPCDLHTEIARRSTMR